MEEETVKVKKPNKRKRLILTIVIVIGVIGLAVWAAVAIFGNDDKQTVTVPPVTDQIVFVDKQKLPKDWQVAGSDNANLLLKTTGTEKNCFVNVIRIPDKFLKASDADEYVEVQKEALQKSAKDKGYTWSELPYELITLQVSGQSQTLRTIEAQISGQNQNLRQSYAFIVRDGYAMQIQSSCTNAKDMPSAKEALKAVSIKI